MDKKTIAVITIIFSVLSILFLLLPPIFPVVEEKQEDIQNNPSVSFEPQDLELNLPLSNDPKNAAWNFFQKYLEYNKMKDLEGVKSTVYKMAPICDDPQKRIDCEARMNSAYQYGASFKKEDFKNFWSDDKQAILATDFVVSEDDTAIGRGRSIIFLIKDDSRNLKILSWSPFKGAYTNKEGAPREELLNRVQTYTEDKDMDGASDYIEECVPAETKDTCTKTDPKNRDTDGDGYWDGVQALK